MSHSEFRNRSIVTLAALGLGVTFLCGCGRISDAERLDMLIPNAQSTVRVTGKVLVNGKPVKDLFVYLNPVDPNPAAGDLLPKAQCDAEGNFDIGSYLGNDGAPAGSYKVTMEWLKQSFGNRWSGPDKLNGKYRDPAKSEFTITVADQPVTDLSYQLEVSGKASGSNSSGPKPLRTKDPKK